MNLWSTRAWGIDSKNYSTNQRLLSFGIVLAIAFIAFIAIAMTDFLRLKELVNHQHITNVFPQNWLTFLYMVAVIGLLIYFNYLQNKKYHGNIYAVYTAMSGFYATLFAWVLDFILVSIFAFKLTSAENTTFSQIFQSYYLANYWPQILFSLATVIVCFIHGIHFRKQRSSVNRRTTSGNLGSADFANEEDLKKYGLRSETGTIVGKNAGGYLRISKPTDRLIMAYRGGGKTSALLIPSILDNQSSNKFMTDIKGELAAVTAEKAKEKERTVYLLDPFGILKLSLGLDIETHSINPLIYLNQEDPMIRDRYVSALAASMVSIDTKSQSESDSHFIENAQIIMEGVLDFYVEKFADYPDKLNLPALHDWWIDIINDPDGQEFEQMLNASHKARAAASQLASAGGNESGSMKTTVYRQIQWLRSDNVRRSFTENEIDISEFVYGNCDIYVVLPEDMVQAHSRMVRMVLGLVKVQIIQAPVNKLKDNYQFLLDELGQFGYCPDIEQIINTLRSRHANVWAIFQTYEQMATYKDRAVFEGMPVKHFLKCHDIETMKWIQQLGDKKTVLTENVSRNVSSSSGKASRASVSESYSVSETSTDLIHYNEIREMPADEQIVFIEGMKPIRCKKAYYFKEPIYKGRYDANPLESG